MNRIEIDINAGGRGTCIVDGVDISHLVGGVSIQTKPGELSRIELSVPADFKWTGEAEVTFSRSGVGTEWVKQFIGHPEFKIRVKEASSQLGMGVSVSDITLQVLAEIMEEANGAH
jgi:hypothetical protein